ncbi:MAG: TetR/AcrR family transcriptional regulator, partial [Gaiellales bacterium]
MPVAARPRLTAADRRAAILAAARSIFARSGFHGASTSRIARAAGCSEPLVYKLFPTKQALFAAVIEDSAMLLRERLGVCFSTATPADRYGAVLDSLAEDPVVAEGFRLRALAIALVDEPEIAAAVEASMATAHAATTASIGESQASGSVRPDVAAADVAWLMMGLALLAAQV